MAVLLILVTHSTEVFVPHQFERFAPGSFLGVDLFFVLSGFLITSLLLLEYEGSGRVSFRNFYRRRALRLLPALVTLLAVHLVYSTITGLDLGVELRSDLVAMLYFSNWFIASGHRFAGDLLHLWSLSVEEQFYVVWPVLTLAMMKVRRGRVVMVVVGIVAIAIWRSVVWKDGTSFFQVNQYRMRTDLVADELLVGALAAHVWVRRWIPRRGLVFGAMVATAFMSWCVVTKRVESTFMHKGGFTLFALAAAIVILSVVERPWVGARVCAWRPLTAVGRRSYGLYLWHLPVFVAVQRYGSHWSTPVRVTVALMISALATVVSYRFVEQPFLRRKSAIGRPREGVSVAQA